MLDLIWRTRFRWKLWPRQATGDSKYGTEENIVALETQHIRAYVALPDNDHRTEFFSADRFRYEVEAMYAFFFSCCLVGNSYFLMGYVCFVVVSPRLPHEQAMAHYPLLMSFSKGGFNTLKPSATQVYLAQETSLITLGINGKGSIFFIELGMHFGGGVSLPLGFLFIES